MTEISSIWSNCSSRDINLMLQKFSCLSIREIESSIINARRSCFLRIVWIDHFSKHSLLSRFRACNVYIDSRILENLNALKIVTTILLTCSNCLFQDMIMLMFSRSRRIYLVDEIYFATFRVYLFVSTTNQFNVIQRHIYIAQDAQKEKSISRFETKLKENEK